MKRQSAGLRRAKEDSQHNQTSEANQSSKRLKVYHQKSILIYSEESGSGSDNTEECPNYNGHKDLSEFLNPEETDLQGSSENGIHQNTNFNGSFENVGNSSTDDASVNNDMNNTSLNNGGSNIQPSNSMNGTELNITESNCMPCLIGHENDFQNATVVDSVESEETVPEEGDQLNVCGMMPNLEPSNGGLSSQEEETELGYQAFMNVEDCINHPVESAPTSEPASQETLDATTSIKVAVCTANGNTETLSSSHKNECQASGSNIASSSKLYTDIESITLCQLNVTLLEGHADVIYSVAADEEFVLSSSADTTVKVWNVEEQKEICNFAGHNASVTSLNLLTAEQSRKLSSKLSTPQNSRIAVSASYDCHIRLWSILDGHEILSMYTFNSITCMDILGDPLYAVIGTEGGKLEVWDLHLAKLVTSVYAHDLSVSHLKVDDCYVYSTSKDGSVKAWLFDDEELQPLYTRRRKEAIVGSSDFGPTQWQSVAVYDDTLFLGDYTSRIKALDWRRGRLRLFVNQGDANGICEAVLAKNNILLTSFIDSNSDTGGINVWKLPEVAYVGTLTGDLQEICSLALTESDGKLRIVSGGHQLLVWDFDFSKPPQKNAKDPFFVCEADKIGAELNEDMIDASSPKRIHLESSDSPENKKSWCNIS